jgi:hypothetical protein
MGDVRENVARVGRLAWTRIRARIRLRRQHRAKLRNQRLRYVSVEQLAYADLLETGVAIGRIFLALTFLLYVFGIVAPKVALSDLPAYWTLSASDYLQVVGVGSGWGWFMQVDHGDYANFVGIAFLIGLTIFCYLRLLQFAWKYRDSVLVTNVALEVIVLTLAASGLWAASH